MENTLINNIENEILINNKKEKYCNDRMKLCTCVFLSAGFVIAVGIIDIYIAMKNDDNSYSII